MLTNCRVFDHDLSNWDVGNVTSMETIFNGDYLFNNGGATGIGAWNTSSCTRMGSMFAYCSGFNQPIGNWDTSNVTHMSNMFRYCDSFNQPIGNWDTSSVITMREMFDHTANGRRSAFNQDIGSWDVSSAVSYTHLTLPTTPYV